MIIEILRHTPAWVWLLLAALLALGASQTRTREVTRGRLLALPLTMLALGIWSLSTLATGQPLALGAWAAAFVAALAAARQLRQPAGAHWSAATARLRLPGSWVPMGIIVAIFALKYGVGVAMGMAPELRLNTPLAMSVAGAYGALSGLLLGRALALLRLTRDASALAATTM
jgi:hypothetical protein